MIDFYLLDDFHFVILAFGCLCLCCCMSRWLILPWKLIFLTIFIWYFYSVFFLYISFDSIDQVCERSVSYRFYFNVFFLNFWLFLLFIFSASKTSEADWSALQCKKNMKNEEKKLFKSSFVCESISVIIKFSVCTVTFVSSFVVKWWKVHSKFLQKYSAHRIVGICVCMFMQDVLHLNIYSWFLFALGKKRAHSNVLNQSFCLYKCLFDLFYFCVFFSAEFLFCLSLIFQIHFCRWSALFMRWLFLVDFYISLHSSFSQRQARFSSLYPFRRT